jgi:ABC-type transporter Mla subunit MlaD
MTENDTPEMKLNDDVQVIRNILFGEHLKNLQDRIATLEQSVRELKEENHQFRQLMQAESNERKRADKKAEENLAGLKSTLVEQITSIEEKTNDQFRILRQDHQEEIKNLNQKQNSQSEQIREEINSHDHKLSNLIAVLASALVEYQRDTPEAK